MEEQSITNGTPLALTVEVELEPVGVNMIQRDV